MEFLVHPFFGSTVDLHGVHLARNRNVRIGTEPKLARGPFGKVVNRLIFKVLYKARYLPRRAVFQGHVKGAAVVLVETVQSDTEGGDVPRYLFKSLNNPVEVGFMDNTVK